MPLAHYWRLSGFYFFYFAALGAYLPYWPLYLKSIGFTAEAIGTLAALLVATKMFAPYLWGSVADRSGRRAQVIRLGSILSCLAFAGTLLSTSFEWLAFIMLVFGLFWNAALPQLEATTLTQLGGATHAYTRIRLWGSVGFIAASWLLGLSMEFDDIPWIPHLILAFLGAVVLASLLIEERPERHEEAAVPMAYQIRQPHVLALLAVCFLMQIGHAPYYTFFSLYLEGYGYALDVIGSLWTLGVLAEIALFLAMQRLHVRFTARAMLLVSLLLAAARWWVIAWLPSMPAAIFAAQLLHAATFGVYHAVAIQLIHRYFPGRLRGRGQALYSSVSFGAGLAVGNLLCGYLWAQAAPGAAFQGSAAVSLVAAFIAWRWVRN